MSEFRRCLENLDTEGVCRLWKHVAPHLPQPKTDYEALATLHAARTQASSIANRLRFYSHRWLEDHGLPSQLPDELKPAADRMYPREFVAVGIGVHFSSSLLKPAEKMLEKAMSDAVMDAYAEGRTDSAFVKSRMSEARAKEEKAIGLMRRAHG